MTEQKVKEYFEALSVEAQADLIIDATRTLKKYYKAFQKSLNEEAKSATKIVAVTKAKKRRGKHTTNYARTESYGRLYYQQIEFLKQIVKYL